MTQRIPTAFFFLVLAYVASAQPVQDWTAYMKLIKKADTLYQKGLYSEAVSAYTAAFTFNRGHYSEGDNYNAARAWAMSGQPDSAIVALRLELEMGFDKIIELKHEKAFQKLHGTRNWKDLLDKTKANKQAGDMKLGKYKKIKPRLEAILIDDQKYRKDYMEILTQKGEGSVEMKELLANMQRVDKKNIKYVSGILDKYGWIDYHIIGYDAAAALFLVVQHADSSIQEKYLPLLEEAVINKMAFGSDLALLEDRVLIRRGQKQKYGSQVKCDSTGKSCYVLPIEDEKNVDKRRAERGMQSLANYLKYWNIYYKFSY